MSSTDKPGICQWWLFTTAAISGDEAVSLRARVSLCVCTASMPVNEARACRHVAEDV